MSEEKNLCLTCTGCEEKESDTEVLDCDYYKEGQPTFKEIKLKVRKYKFTGIELSELLMQFYSKVHEYTEIGSKSPIVDALKESLKEAEQYEL